MNLLAVLLLSFCLFSAPASAQYLGATDVERVNAQTSYDAAPVPAAAATAPDAGPIQGPPEPSFADKVQSDPAAAAGHAVDAISDGNWKLVAAFALAFVMLFANKLRIKRLEGFWKTKRGGAVLVMLLSLVGAFASALSTGAALGKSMLAGVIVAWVAAGMRTWAKNLLFGGGGDSKTLTEVAKG